MSPPVVVTRSLRTALAHGDRHIGDEHLLLALTARPGVPAEVLADRGVTFAAVERLLWGGGAAKASQGLSFGSVAMAPP